MFIRKAERKKAKLRLGISGASGSGKTWSALEIATGMGGKVGMIDTESGRGELYGNDFEYDVVRLEAPYSVERYVEAIRMFEKAGYDTLIIDSLSHAWEGQGGVLTTVDAGGGWFSKGGQRGSAEQNALIHSIVTSKMHVITTMRAKTEYALEKDDRGKNSIRKVGLAPVQRNGVEYEFTVFMTMEQNHFANITKDNTKMFDQKFIKPAREMGAQLIEWLNNGIDEAKDKFLNVIKPAILEEIKAIENMKEFNEYKETYINHYRLYADDYSEDFVDITHAKDAKKEELMNQEINSMAPPIIAPITKSKYSQALTQIPGITQ